MHGAPTHGGAVSVPAVTVGAGDGRVTTGLLRDPADLIARAVIVSLFLGLTYRLAEDFLATGRVTGLLLLVSEFLVVALTCIRRPALWVERSMVVRFVTAVSIVGPTLIQPAQRSGSAPEAITTFVSAIGLSIIVMGKMSLGRSFGLLPAHRGIVQTGLYRLVRHPIYLGYLITHAAFLAAHPTPWNVLVLAMGDVALVVRARCEEQTLVRNPLYATYLTRVRWRILPGVL